MENTSPRELARELLRHCLEGRPWPGMLLQALIKQSLDADADFARMASKALFGVVVERLADLFEPSLCDTYAELFSHVIESALPQLEAEALVARYKLVRQVRRVESEPRRIFVPSRVTLGADVAITSIVLDGARRRYPGARISFVGSQKAWELFEKDPRLDWVPLPYVRAGSLRERLAGFESLRATLSEPGSIVLDPDSRLTQLGLLPVCPPERHYLFESRSYGGISLEPLPVLTARWVNETLGIADAEPYLHPRFHFDFGSQPIIAVSLGVGENPAKRLPDPFEEELLAHIAAQRAAVIVDLGAGGEEQERVDRARARVPGAGVHEGAFASFAALIASSAMFVGYDSAGQHVAAALGIPLVSIFTGHVNDRMFARWRPYGPGPRTVIRVEDQDVQDVLQAARAAISL